MTVNKVILIGNLGKDPEVKQLENGNSFANFSLATSESYKNKTGEKQTDTEWHNIVIWGKLVDVVKKYVKKGDRIYLEGKIKSRSYQDKDGNKRYLTDIIANNLTMLGVCKDENKADIPDNNVAQSQEGDDLPF